MSTPSGAIGFFNLQGWWCSALSQSQRRQIEEFLSEQDHQYWSYLTQDDISDTNATAAALLTGLADRLIKDETRSLARIIILEAGRQACAARNTLDLHFAYDTAIRIYYRDRNDPEYLEKAIEACTRMIALGPLAKTAFRREYPEIRHLPGHHGYYQLGVIHRKQKNWAESDRLEKEAKKQGWQN